MLHVPPSDQSFDRICVDLEISRNQFGISTNITFALTVQNTTVSSSVVIGYEYLNLETLSSADYLEANESEPWTIDLIPEVGSYFIPSVVCAQSAVAHRAG